ncbi:hypothetical protein ACUZB6_005612, partial [Escherichia coli]
DTPITLVEKASKLKDRYSQPPARLLYWRDFSHKKTRLATGVKNLLTSGIKRPSLGQIYHRFGKNQQSYLVTFFSCCSAHASSISNCTTSVS